jgi:hypothetical protein
VFEEDELLKIQKSGQFPDEPVRIKVGQLHYLTYVLVIAVINDTTVGDLLL